MSSSSLIILPQPQIVTAAGRDIAEAMQGYNKIMDAAKKRFPKASSEELYRVTEGAMRRAMGLK